MGSPPAFICGDCDVLLWDGVLYEQCPACDRRVERVDPTLPVWCCRTSTRMVNAAVEAPVCEHCDTRMVAAFASSAAPGNEGESGLEWIRRAASSPTALAILVFVCLLPVASLAVDPVFRWIALGLVGPFVLLPVVSGGYFLGLLAASLPEIRALIHERRARVVHGFEHATAHLLEAESVRVLYGQTFDGGSFELVLDESRKPCPPAMARTAIVEAVRRIQAGDKELALHRRCGSTWLVLATLLALSTVIVCAAGLLLHETPGTMLVLMLSLLALVLSTAQPLGRQLQRHWTVSTEFRAARVLRLVRRAESMGTVYEVSFAVDLGDAKEVTREAEAAPPRRASAPPAPRPRVLLEGIACPLCAWVPAESDLWKCTCGWRWNTFQTEGRCPACDHAFDSTQCLGCRKQSPHRDWYRRDGKA